MKVKATNYGGIITEIHVPDRNGTFADVAYSAGVGYNADGKALAGMGAEIAVLPPTCTATPLLQ